ncbi:protein DOG1-like 4 [Momordica charantia]|uniref:Protein DOG1-like 4 n=1 Tax=Momordica charantia TaxID=3673 RepID=A0A6J1C1F8_MOMCH|nr:protein DOG1-like 4 [Momordica charantia]
MSDGFNFSGFYATWLDHLHRLIHQLSAAAAKSGSITQQTVTDHDHDHDNNHNDSRHLVHTVMSHYSDYYRVKSVAAERDPLSVFSAPWATSLERSLHWIAGWRPTTAFHLIYSESSILFESRIVDILHGLRTGDLGDLSPSQFRRVSDLQCQTVNEENTITEELSEWQDDVSELVGTQTELAGRVEGLVRIIKKADDLRLRTVQKVVELLTPKQAVEFLVAAAELQFGVRGWGLNQDRQRGNE